MFQGIKGFDPNTQITFDDLQFADSVRLNTEVTEFDGLSFFIVVVIIFFTVSVIVSSFLVWYFKKERQREEEDRPRRSRSSSQKQGKSKRQEGIVRKDENETPADNSTRQRRLTPPSQP